MDPVPFLPEDEPTTLEAVKHVLGITDDNDDADLSAAVAAACVKVRGLPVAVRALGLAAWPVDLQRGATLLAAGMFPRRKKPTGGRVFAVDDPELQVLLELGPYSRPAVG